MQTPSHKGYTELTEIPPGRREGGEPIDPGDHYYICVCGAVVDKRDLIMVLRHEDCRDD